MKQLSKLTLILLMVFACTGLAIAKNKKNAVILDCEFAEAELPYSEIIKDNRAGEALKHPSGFKATFIVCNQCDGREWLVSPTEYYGRWSGSGNLKGEEKLGVRINRFNGQATFENYIEFEGKLYPYTLSGQCKKVDKPIM